MQRSDVLRYFVMEYFDGSIERASEATEYSVDQIRSWVDGRTQPQKQTVEYVAHCALAPEFKVVVEFANLVPENPVRTQLREALRGHESQPGIYAFYDSMANLLYVGKASRLLDEMYQAIRQDISIAFPRGITEVPEKRYEVVKYFSAYDVGSYNHIDYPRHVESLILRLSKPPLNQRIGHLEHLQSSEET